MRDMRANDVDVLTLGQYLRPTEHHLAVVEYVTPEKFDFFRVKGEVRIICRYMYTYMCVDSDTF